MKGFRLRKRQGFPHKAAQALPQGVVPTFHMVGGPARFADRPMLGRWHHFLPAFPKIGEGQTVAIRPGQAIPQPLTSFVTAVAEGKGHNLARPTAHHGPEPHLIDFGADKTPGFIAFQHIAGLPGQEGRLQGRQRVGVFPDPHGDLLPGDMKHAGQSAHTHAFLIGGQDGAAVFFFAARRDSSTRRTPHTLPAYCCWPNRLCPFLTMSGLPQVRQV